MEAWEKIKKLIHEARIHELDKMEMGAFKTDISSYNESVGFLRALRFIEEVATDINKQN